MAEADHLSGLRDLSNKVVLFTDTQAEKTAELREANDRADTALVGSRPPLPAPRTGRGIGVVDMVGDMWRTRVRITELLTLGGRR